jgi:hypothetical protein
MPIRPAAIAMMATINLRLRLKVPIQARLSLQILINRPLNAAMAQLLPAMRGPRRQACALPVPPAPARG